MKKIKISQSLIKDLEKYFAGEQCGRLVYNKYVSGVLTEPSDSMALGQYFEFKATGALPKGGKEPQPETTQKGELTAAYKRAESNAAFFKKLCEEMGIVILKAGEYGEKNGMNGTRDIKALWNGETITIDLKYSGLIDNKYEEMGWGDLYGKNDRGKQYWHHSIQAAQYTYIFGNPFYFWVWNPGKEGENIMIKMEIDEQQLLDHEQVAKDAAKRWNILGAHERAGLSALPEFNTCRSCVMAYRCEHKTNVPIPKSVKITDK